eukprot:CAMPEP_0114556198 /NCGR_PEP_ID=MMETSP0114-20121206/9165_1 /TAXON_ID=31324 /ORGANISM="Goniomonas sp, Strain m" /LENGTH=62 /DNA_ID=CAMNT_0001741395 /DNA_START=30 /DNA_END=218 /DNA_ORIENTATION=-
MFTKLRYLLAYMPQQGNEQPNYSVDDSDLGGVSSGFAEKNPDFQYGNLIDPARGGIKFVNIR